LLDTLATGADLIGELWDTELTSIDDRSVTVGKVTCGMSLLVLGIMLSRWFVGTFAKRVLGRFGIQGGAAVAFESLSFYLLVVAWVLMALHMVHVPLTFFTFMGGAVAIGVGFGSQKVLNNFISGVILLVEQPVRVGDVVELGNLSGVIESIGTRSTRVRTGANTDIIIPNSTFLENNVVNWTLGDSLMRCSLKVGIAYGSNTRDAAHWLKRAADEHGLVHKKPDPFVLFSDFGDNAMVLELFFWIDVHDRRRIESDLRFIIDQYFREGGITLAFPQRDVHLDTIKPLDVRVLPSENQSLDSDHERRAA
ncbi:MAG TPA: mechanosensitive ion channel domain-containing protein, partial [Pirellulales bacterium]|nr:mechanosensitive ion channel domain-containing protein [Pirellulales bacterium]